MDPRHRVVADPGLTGLRALRDGAGQQEPNGHPGTPLRERGDLVGQQVRELPATRPGAHNEGRRPR